MNVKKRKRKWGGMRVFIRKKVQVILQVEGGGLAGLEESATEKDVERVVKGKSKSENQKLSACSSSLIN